MGSIVWSEYKTAVEDFKKICTHEANLNAEINTDVYPMRICLTPAEIQQDMFKNQEEENIENGSIEIILASEPKLQSTLKFHIDAALLKKLIKKAAKLGELYLRAFRGYISTVITHPDNYGKGTVELLKKLCSPD